jgi:hypothetical protein
MTRRDFIICEGDAANKMVEIIKTNMIVTRALFFTTHLQFEKLFA